MRLSRMLRFNQGLVRVAQLMLMLLLMSHWAGCVWWIVSELDTDAASLPDDTWMPPWGALWWIRSQPFGTQYAQSLMWGAAIMTTLTPFEVKGHTATESIFTVVLMFAGLFINIFVIAATTNALAHMDARWLEGQQKVETISKYLVYKRVPAKLSERIVAFYEYQNSRFDQSSKMCVRAALHCTLSPSEDSHRVHRLRSRSFYCSIPYEARVSLCSTP